MKLTKGGLYAIQNAYCPFCHVSQDEMCEPSFFGGAQPHRDAANWQHGVHWARLENMVSRYRDPTELTKADLAKLVFENKLPKGYGAPSEDPTAHQA